MPVAPNRANPGRQAVAVAIAGILGAVAIFFLLTRAVNFGDGRAGVDIDLGQDVFQPGNVDRLSEDIAKAGPLLLADVSGSGDKDAILQHVGDDPMTGWSAFAARQPEQSRPCVAVWMEASRTFVDDCTGAVYPQDGTGLPSFPVTISADGELSVNLKPDANQEQE